MDWRLSCPDWRERIRAGRSLMPSLPLHDERARKAVAIFNLLRIPDVPGTPTFAEAGGDWFREIVAALHGSLDPETRERAIRELFVLVPKKNAKTTMGAGLMMTSLLMNERPRAEFLLVAPTQDVALLAFNQVSGMIDLDAKLAERFHVQGHLKKVTYGPTQATLQVKSFDPKVMTGVKPSGVLVDELHVIAESADADRVMGQIRGGIISQPEGFVAMITTQSERPPRGVFKAELAKARAIRDGRVNGKMLSILYEFPEDLARKAPPGERSPWEDPAHWGMVTPNNGRSITVSRLVEDYETAKLASHEELARWASQHLNIEIGLGLQTDAWEGAEFWEGAGEAMDDLGVFLDRVEVVVAGIDGGGLDDLLGLCLLGRERATGRWLAWCRAWAHEIVLQRRKGEASRLRDMERDGHLTIVSRPGEDVSALADIILEVDGRGLLAEKSAIGVDPAGIVDIVDEIVARGIALERIVSVSQGWRLNGAIKTTARKLAGGELAHEGSPLMAWCVGNAKTEPRGNAITITKQVSGSAKIDPLMALFNAVSLMSLNPESGSSVYSDERGILFFG